MSLDPAPRIHQALSALDQLETERLDAADKQDADQARHTLTALVQQVCQTHGVTQTRQAIEAAISASTKADPKGCPAPVQRPLRRSPGQVLAAIAGRTQDTWQAWRARLASTTTRQISPTVRLVGRALALSATLTTALYLWGLTTLRWPFALALHHTGVFYTGVVALLLTGVLILKDADRLAYFTEKRVRLWTGWGMGLTVLMTIAASVGLAIGTDMTDANATQYLILSIRADFRAAPKTDFAHRVDAANRLLSLEHNPQVSIYDPRTDQIAFVATLSQKACERVMDNLDPNFMITHVNRVKVPEGSAPVCPNLWINDVQIANRPHTL